MLTRLTEKDRDELIYFDSVLDSIARSKTAADIAEIREELALQVILKGGKSAKKNAPGTEIAGICICRGLQNYCRKTTARTII